MNRIRMIVRAQLDRSRRSGDPVTMDERISRFGMQYWFDFVEHYSTNFGTGDKTAAVV